jgi:GNAT superfamily N-acetyltransferase
MKLYTTFILLFLGFFSDSLAMSPIEKIEPIDAISLRQHYQSPLARVRLIEAQMKTDFNKDPEGVGNITYDLINRDCGEIILFQVNDCLRNRGIGTRLFNACIEDFMKAGISTIFWEIVPLDNALNKEKIITIYKKLAQNIPYKNRVEVMQGQRDPTETFMKLTIDTTQGIFS